MDTVVGPSQGTVAHVRCTPENWIQTQALICLLLIFTTKEIEDVETKAACA